MTIKHENEKAAEEWANGLIDFFERLVPLTEIEIDRFRQAATKGFLAGGAYRDRWWSERWFRYNQPWTKEEQEQMASEMGSVRLEMLEEKE